MTANKMDVDEGMSFLVLFYLVPYPNPPATSYFVLKNNSSTVEKVTVAKMTRKYRSYIISQY